MNMFVPLWFIFITIFGFCYGSELYFVERPQSSSVIEGAPVNISCRLSQDNGVHYHWELDGNPVHNSGRRHELGSDLVILRADKVQDSGEFVCNAKSRSTGFRLRTEPVKLHIQWIGNCSVALQEPASASAIQPGVSVTLQCQGTGSGELHHEWFRNTERLSKSSRYDIKKNKLHLKSVSSEDNGVYRCSSRNEAGVTTSETNFILAVKASNGQVIEVVPKDQLLKVGDDAHFQCKYSGLEKVQWVFKETPLNNNDRIIISENGSLKIKAVDDQDAGVYKCIGDGQEYIAELKIVHLGNLTIHNFEPILYEDHVMPVPLGKKFQITCIPTQGYPKPKVLWKGPKSHEIPQTGKVHAEDNILVIEKAAYTDSGFYTCINENIAGSTKMEINVKVIKQHNITAHPFNVTVDENHSVKMTCKHSGMNHNDKHYTTIKWFKDGKALRYENGRMNFNESDGSLFFNQTLSRDKGSYTCEIITQGFSPVVSIPGMLNIIEKLKFSPPPLNKNLELGTMGKIHCKANGTPNPTIVWKMVGLESGLPDDVEDINGSLIFKNVSNEHNGKYICTAFNTQGSINTTIVVTVVVSPKFSMIPQNPTEVNEGAQVMLHCQANGLPKPTVHWDQNLQMDNLKNDRFTVFENGTLLINEVKLDDENRYGCTAGNSAGLRREEISLVVRPLVPFETDNAQTSSTITRAVIVTVAVAVAYIMLVIALMVWCKCRRKRKAALNKLEFDNEEIKLNGECSKAARYTAKDEIHNDEEIQEIGKKAKECKTDGFDTANSNCSANSKSSKKSSCYDKISLQRDSLSDYLKVGAGQFGDIMIAQLTMKPHEIAPETEKPNKQLVLVKSLTNTKDEGALSEFKRQLDLYYKIQCDQVVKLLGLCRETNPHLMVLEFTDWGDFKQFLLATTGAKTEGSQPPPLKVPQMLSLCHQIAKGMEYISKSRLVHKDLACRNCVIDSKLCIKISHSASSLDIYKEEYFEHANQIIPLRWMPYEAVFEDDFSTKSDIYSFGCVVWEIFTGGQLPFRNLSSEEVLQKLKDKSLKYDCHNEMADCLKQILENCWSYCPNERPSFSKISSYLKEYLKKEFECLEVNKDAEQAIEKCEN